MAKSFYFRDINECLNNAVEYIENRTVANGGPGNVEVDMFYNPLLNKYCYMGSDNAETPLARDGYLFTMKVRQ